MVRLLLSCLLLMAALNAQTENHRGEATMEKYLYKVLSTRHWQIAQNRNIVVLPAEEDAFIHLAKEDQLEGVLSKYWADAPQFVILTIDPKKLEGRLVYETNPGGTTSYYHLYDGRIPFQAIVESKTVFREVPPAQGLEIVQIGDPVLRQRAGELSAEEIVSPEIQGLIQDMIATMRAAPGVGLAAPQIGKNIQLAVVEDADLSHLTPEQCQERCRYPFPLHVIINPRLYVEEVDTAEFFEGCLSVPGVLGAVPRALSVRVECLNEKAEPVVLHARGWTARILQHEIDHLNGVVYIDRAATRTIVTEENYVKLSKGKSTKEVIASLKIPS